MKTNRIYFIFMAFLFIVFFGLILSSGNKTTDFPTTSSTILSETSNQNKITAQTEVSQHDNKKITISFLGDCMMASYKGESVHGNMNWCLDNKPFTYFFEKAMPYIGNDDFTITNCECVFTDTATSEVHKNHSPAYWYRSSSKNAGVFSMNSIDAVGIANNHIADYGIQGKEDTKKALESAGVLWGNDNQEVILEKNGVKIALLLMNFWETYQSDKIVSKLINLNETTDIQIVYFHGGTERIYSPEQWKVNGVHKFVDAGADLVLGAHPHVLQPHEEYKGVDIVYSLGNFCYGGSKSPENRTIIYQETFTLDPENHIIESNETIIPFYVFTGTTNNWQPAPIEDSVEKNAVLEFMYGKTSSPFPK